ncbi:MAG TPA: phospholipid carrier-dependent glycosyltransferase, partial [Abditibacteriaceae bacterium]
MCALLFGLALALRLAGLTWGLPTAERWYSLHPDERQIAIAVAGLDFFGGDFNPDFYNYPSLAIYLAYFMHGIGALFGVFGATQTPFGLLSDLVMSGRLVTAFLGAATAPLVFLVAREVVIAHSGHQNRVAALAGILMALSPGHLQHSHFATVDVPATFFITLCLWLSVRTMNNAARQRTRLLILAALAAGLAAATKYNAGLVALAPIVAAWLPSQAMPGESTTEKPH